LRFLILVRGILQWANIAVPSRSPIITDDLSYYELSAYFKFDVYNLTFTVDTLPSVGLGDQTLGSALGVGVSRKQELVRFVGGGFCAVKDGVESNDNVHSAAVDQPLYAIPDTRLDDVVCTCNT
jgi:hypothetical protein